MITMPEWYNASVIVDRNLAHRASIHPNYRSGVDLAEGIWHRVGALHECLGNRRLTNRYNARRGRIELVYLGG
jgi:hypothetical protein